MIEGYPYLYETHLHTNQGSACARNSGREMVAAAKAAGYTGIIITEHNWGGNTCVDRSLPWETWVREFCRGYEEAKKWGDENGLDVFWGYEAGFHGTEFLIYGITPQWLAEHPEIREAPLETHLSMIREAGGMVIHAHPFREEWYIPKVRLYPHLVDGVEGVNASHSNSRSTGHNNREYDQRAISYAREQNLPMTAGSDVHSTMLFGGGVAFPTRLENIQDYCARIRGDADYVLTNGEQVYDKQGNPKGSL